MRICRTPLANPRLSRTGAHKSSQITAMAILKITVASSSIDRTRMLRQNKIHMVLQPTQTTRKCRSSRQYGRIFSARRCKSLTSRNLLNGLSRVAISTPQTISPLTSSVARLLPSATTTVVVQRLIILTRCRWRMRNLR